MWGLFKKQAKVIALIALAGAANIAEARIGENYRQCVARYGNSYTNFPGLTHLLGVAVFEKDGVNVTVAFDRPNRQGFLVLYTGGRFLTLDERRDAADLKDNEVDSLMSSLSISWETPEYEPPKATAPASNSRIDPSMRSFAGPKKVKGGGSSYTMPSAAPVKKTTSAPKPPKWTENLGSAKKAVKDFVEAVTLEKPRYEDYGAGPKFFYEKLHVGGFIFWPGVVALEPYRRSGDHLFAFKLVAGGKCYGLVLVNSDAAKAISGWSEAYVKSHDNPPPKDKGRTLQGF